MRISDWSSDVCSSDLKQGKITMADDRRVYLFDSTLRDGAQTQGVDFTVPDKLAIARALDRLGADYVEGGRPGDRKSVASGKRGSVGVDPGGRRITSKKNKSKHDRQHCKHTKHR